MSSVIHIPLAVVLSHPGQFQMKAVLNVDPVDVCHSYHEGSLQEDIDWDYILSGLEPVLMCKFGARNVWRCVEVTTSCHAGIADRHYLHISCSGDFRTWLQYWLVENGHEHEVLD